MEKSNYPEIQSLEEIYIKYEISISVSESDFLAGKNDYPAVVFSLKNKSFKLYVSDEYGDLKTQNPILELCLILRELENYEFENDYLVWCKAQMLEAANSQVRDFHLNLRNVYMDVEKIIGKINSHVSNFDFELNAGAAQELRKSV